MNFYRKINKYILERFPTFWNTQFLWLILLGILTHLLFFAFGYFSLNIEDLKSYGVGNLFFRKSYFGFYILLCLIVFIFFAFRFFAHNPFKNFYPVSKSYFWKIYGQLFFIFIIFISVFISFENGEILKTKKLVPASTFLEETNKINLAYPFLFNDIVDYHIEKRIYPKPFPCDEITNFAIGYDSINDISIKHGIDENKPFVYLNDNLYQFGILEDINIDSCKTETKLTKIVDVSNVYGLSEYSLFNFNKIGIPKVLDSIYKYENYVSTIHKWYLNKDKASIENSLQDLVSICQKYNISQELNPSKMANAVLLQDLNNQTIITTGFYDYKNEDRVNYRNYAADVATEAVSTDEDESRKYKKNNESNYSVDFSSLSLMADNLTTVHSDLGYHKFGTEFNWILIFSSLFAAMLLMISKFIEIKDLLIGIVIAGILATILSLSFFFIIEKNNSISINRDIIIMFFATFYASIILGIGLVGMYSKKFKKTILTKWFISMSISIVCILPTILIGLRELTKTEKRYPCDNGYGFEYTFELQPWYFLVLALLSIYLIFHWIRKIHAKAE